MPAPYRYYRNNHQAPRTALHLADFIIDNVEALRRKDSTGNMEEAVTAFRMRLKNGETLSPNQYSYLEAIYESTLKGMGLESVPTHHDPGARRYR
jgi:hypothetical protein